MEVVELEIELYMVGEGGEVTTNIGEERRVGEERFSGNVRLVMIGVVGR